MLTKGEIITALCQIRTQKNSAVINAAIRELQKPDALGQIISICTARHTCTGCPMREGEGCLLNCEPYEMNETEIRRRFSK